jgi:hypothetical protein
MVTLVVSFIQDSLSDPVSQTIPPRSESVTEFWGKGNHIYGVTKRASGSKQNDRNHDRLE